MIEQVKEDLRRILLRERLPTLGPVLLWCWDMLRGCFLRPRAIITWVIPLVLMFLLFRNDPDPDKATSLIFSSKLLERCIVVALAHFTLKKLCDYVEADRRNLFKIIIEKDSSGSPIGAGLGLVALAIMFVGLLWAFGSAHAATLDIYSRVPARCIQNLSVLKAEQQRWWGDHPDAAWLSALGEHESCVSLDSSRCCNTTSQLKACRKDGTCEEGASILQVTRVWRKDGTLRMDVLQELKDRHPMLREWSWENAYQRADLANRALVLMAHDNYMALRPLAADDLNGLRFADVAHNAGRGRIITDRRACALAKASGCDPRVWQANVEIYCTAGRTALYGNRGPCEISRHHVADTEKRVPKYRRYWT